MSVRLQKAARGHYLRIKRGRLVTRQQVRVASQRERGRVMAQGAAQLEQVGALAEVERGEGVAECVEACPGGVGLLSERLENAAAEIVGIERAACFAGEGEGGRALIGLSGEVGSQLRRERLR